VRNLLEVARLRTVARAAGIGDIAVQGNFVRFGPLDLRESQVLRLQRLYKGALVKPALHQILVPKPMTAPIGGQPLRDQEVLTWAASLIRAAVMDNVGEGARVATQGQATTARSR
jgi:transcription-repair coupling factor (superfamily II helicase)